MWWTNCAARRWARRWTFRPPITVVDPRRFIDANYRRHPICRDQIELADVLAASKGRPQPTPPPWRRFREQSQALFPPRRASK